MYLIDNKQQNYFHMWMNGLRTSLSAVPLSAVECSGNGSSTFHYVLTFMEDTGGREKPGYYATIKPWRRRQL